MTAESPKGRRSLCYDLETLDSRKEFKPKSNAVEMAAEIGIELLTEEQYRELQNLGDFDTKTSSWVKTPTEIRKLGGAVFCDRRYNHVFLYHNGAESYYAARGFRGYLRIKIIFLVTKFNNLSGSNEQRSYGTCLNKPGNTKIQLESFQIQ